MIILEIVALITTVLFLFSLLKLFCLVVIELAVKTALVALYAWGVILSGLILAHRVWWHVVTRKRLLRFIAKQESQLRS